MLSLVAEDLLGALVVHLQLPVKRHATLVLKHVLRVEEVVHCVQKNSPVLKFLVVFEDLELFALQRTNRNLSLLGDS